MAFVIVQPIQSGDTGNNPTDAGGGVTPITFTYTHAQTAGNCNLVALAWDDTIATLVSLSDSSGNTYQHVLSVAANNLTLHVFVALGIASAGAGANTVTASVNVNGHFAFAELFCIEVSGVTAIDLATTLVATGHGALASVGPVTCAYLNELLIGYCWNNAAATGTGTGWAFVNWGNGGQITGYGSVMEQQTTSTGGAFTATTPLNSTTDWGQAIVGLASGSPIQVVQVGTLLGGVIG